MRKDIQVPKSRNTKCRRRREAERKKREADAAAAAKLEAAAKSFMGTRAKTPDKTP